MKKENARLCIVTFPILPSGITPLSNLIRILGSLTTDLTLLSGNAASDIDEEKIKKIFINTRTPKNTFEKITVNLLTQIRITFSLFSIRNNSDIFFFTLGGETLIMPIIFLKVARKKIVIIEAASTHQMLKYMGDKLSIVSKIFETVNFNLVDRIVVYSKGLIKEYGLEAYQKKIFIAPEHIIDELFIGSYGPVDGRKNIIGFIGRFSGEKGILNFIKAIPLIKGNVKDAEFIIIGDGLLKDKVIDYIEKNNFSSFVTIKEWVEHEKLPKALIKIKVLIVPSYTEGLPNIILEGMSCGAIILSSNVGAIPDIIENGKTGFLLKDNDPMSIKDSVNRILKSGLLDEISKNAHSLVKNEFNLDYKIKRYEKLIMEL